jgi:MoxR-like ATPase
MQKLVRKAKDSPTTPSVKTLGESIDDVIGIIQADPMGLLKFAQASVAATPAPVQAPAVTTPPIVEAYEAWSNSPAPVAVTAVVDAPVVAEPEPVNALVTAPSAPTLAKLTVPEPEDYYERTFDGVTETSLYDYARNNQRKVLLTGDAGTGKTSSARNYAAKRNLPFITIECTQQIDQSITQGRFVPTGVGNSTKWVYSQLATAVQQPSVILLNELTRMNPKAASLFLRLLQENELLIEPLNEVIKVHPECLIIADQNTGSGYTGTQRQDQALVDRFNVKLEFKYDDAIESKFIKSPTLLAFANSIRQASETSDQFSVPMSTRMLKNFEEQAVKLNFQFAVNSLLSAFPKDDSEREAIKMRFDAEYDKIAEELNVDPGSYSIK